MSTNRKTQLKRQRMRTIETMLPIQKVEEEVKKYIIGQDKQVRQIITAIYRSMNFRTMKSNILIVGKSGTGKTETIKQIAKILHLPYTIEDATKYTQEGYVGNSVEDMIYNLFENANYNLEKAQRGILVIDEIDKKARKNEIIDASHDATGTEVLKSLLKIIEGTTITLRMGENYDVTEIKFNTKNLIVVLLGAFDGIDKIVNKRLNRTTIGFRTVSEERDEESSSRILKQDLINYGIPEEFVGRIDTIVEMKNLTEQDLSTILKKSKLSIFKSYKMELIKKKIILVHSEELFDLIAKQSLSLDTGARELNSTVNYMFERILYEVFSNPNKYSLCHLRNDIVTDNTQYELV